MTSTTNQDRAEARSEGLASRQCPASASVALLVFGVLVGAFAYHTLVDSTATTPGLSEPVAPLIVMASTTAPNTAHTPTAPTKASSSPLSPSPRTPPATSPSSSSSPSPLPSPPTPPAVPAAPTSSTTCARYPRLPMCQEISDVLDNPSPTGKEWIDYMPTSIEPIKVPSLDYEFPLCSWMTDGLGYPRSAPGGPRPLLPNIKQCADQLMKWARQGKTMFSADAGSLLASVTSGGHHQGVDDLDMNIISETGLTRTVYSHCSMISIGNHGMTWLPKRSEVGDEAYRKEYVKYADTFCTCQFGGPFLCIKSALDDKPTKETLGVGPGTGDYGGPTWNDRKWTFRYPTRLDDDRGSAFWSVKYKFGPSYWIPPSRSSAGKDMCPNRARLFGVPGTGLYRQPHWIGQTLAWCKDMFTTTVADASELTYARLLTFVDTAVQKTLVNPFWLNRALVRSPCFLTNARNFLDYTCKFLARVEAANKQGTDAARKPVYEGYHAPPLKSLDASSPDKAVCRDEIMGAVCGPTAASAEWVKGSKSPPSYAFRCVLKI